MNEIELIFELWKQEMLKVNEEKYNAMPDRTIFLINMLEKIGYFKHQKAISMFIGFQIKEHGYGYFMTTKELSYQQILKQIDLCKKRAKLIAFE